MPCLRMEKQTKPISLWMEIQTELISLKTLSSSLKMKMEEKRMRPSFSYVKT
jgi:hypothetical protein